MTMPANGGAPTTVIEPGFRDHCTDFGCSQVPEAVSSVDWQPCTAQSESCHAVTSADVATDLGGPATAAPLEDLAYTAHLSNHGPDAAPGSTLRLEWSGASFKSVDTEMTCTLGTGTLACAPTSLERLADRQVTLHLTAPSAPGIVHVTARGETTASDDVPANDDSSVDTTVSDDPIEPRPRRLPPTQRRCQRQCQRQCQRHCPRRPHPRPRPAG